MSETKTKLSGYSIELDCAPGGARPNEYLPGVLEGTGLTSDDFTIASKFFGNWKFVCHEDKIEQFVAARETIKGRVKALYPSRIRYGSW